MQLNFLFKIYPLSINLYCLTSFFCFILHLLIMQLLLITILCIKYNKLHKTNLLINNVKCFKTNLLMNILNKLIINLVFSKFFFY